MMGFEGKSGCTDKDKICAAEKTAENCYEKRKKDTSAFCLAQTPFLINF